MADVSIRTYVIVVGVIVASDGAVVVRELGVCCFNTLFNESGNRIEQSAKMAEVVMISTHMVK